MKIKITSGSKDIMKVQELLHDMRINQPTFQHSDIFSIPNDYWVEVESMLKKMKIGWKKSNQQQQENFAVKSKFTKRDLVEMVRRIINEAKYRSVKVTYSDGTFITTSLNPNITDSEIKDYFKIGRTANIGNADKDKIVTIKNVEILPDEEF